MLRSSSHLVSPSESTFGYSALEEEILRFHCAFTAFWDGRISLLLREQRMKHLGERHGEPVVPSALVQPQTLLQAAEGSNAAGAEAATAVGGDTGAAAPTDAESGGGEGGDADASSGANDSSTAGASTATSSAAPASEASRQLAALSTLLDAVHLDEAYQRLWFDFRHITDELVFYGMCAQSSLGQSQVVAPLANLCYKMLFRHEIFETFCGPTGAMSGHGHHMTGAASGVSGGANVVQPRQQRRMLNLAVEARAQLPPLLLKWVKQLSYFLMHFPDVEGGIAPLRRLHRALRAASRLKDKEAAGAGA